jgi:hypothetical protein
MDYNGIKKDRQHTCQSNIEELPYTHVCHGKAVSIKYSECVFVALVMQHASACAILLSEACSALRELSTLSHKRHDFRENITEHKVCA